MTHQPFVVFTVALAGLSMATGTAVAQAAQAAPAALTTPAPHDTVVRHLLRAGLTERGALVALEKILSVGPRLTGSREADAAVRVAAAHMTALGFENVHVEPTVVGHWVRGRIEEGAIVPPTGPRIAITVRALGNSIGTPATGITAGIVEVRSIAELATIGDRARGRIVFFNGAMDPTLVETFAAYGGAAAQRSAGASAAAKVGAIAAVVRSLTTEINDDPHTGMMRYEPDAPMIPAASISTAAADRLSAILKAHADTRLYLRTSAKILEPVTSHNVMGEIRGSEFPNEVIVVGGHLDSWDLSVGAHDDGAGCAQSIEVVRLLRTLGLRPKRTIRAVLYMDEENGGTGGRDYVKAPQRTGETHVAAMESDRGGFVPLGIGVNATGATYDRIKSWEPLFQQAGLQWIRPGGGGVDIAPLGPGGTILMGLVPDSQRYFDVHHSGIDTLATVNARELELGAIHMALMAWLVSEEGLPRP